MTARGVARGPKNHACWINEYVGFFALLSSGHGPLLGYILEGLPSKQYQVHQQRAPDLCGPTFHLITRNTPILDSRSQTSALEGQRPRHIPDAGELLICHHHMFNKTGTASTQHSKSSMEAYQGGTVTISVGVGFILLCVTNIASNKYRNNAI